MRKSSKLLYKVGINDADYVVNLWQTVASVNGKQKQILIWRCPFHTVWKDMIKRCYCHKYHANHPSYADCTVCEEWLTFSNFKAWMENQDWEGRQLDKDLLVRGNKVYSPLTCVFLPSQVNVFLIESRAKRGLWPLGVSLHTQNNNFIAHCSSPFSKKKEHLGVFETPQLAHKAWLNRKYELAKQLASVQDDVLIANALLERYKNYDS